LYNERVGGKMSKILLTKEQVKELRKNKWIKNVSEKAITYTDEFKYKLVKETERFEKFPRDVFKECGIEPEWIGKKRIENFAYKWRKRFKKSNNLEDTRKTKSGRTLKRELSDKEKLERAEAKIKLLEAENELLKKNELIDLGIIKDIESISNSK